MCTSPKYKPSQELMSASAYTQNMYYMQQLCVHVSSTWSLFKFAWPNDLWLRTRKSRYIFCEHFDLFQHTLYCLSLGILMLGQYRYIRPALVNWHKTNAWDVFMLTSNPAFIMIHHYIHTTIISIIYPQEVGVNMKMLLGVLAGKHKLVQTHSQCAAHQDFSH